MGIATKGRPREFCRRSCRQRDYEARTRAKAHGLDEHELVMARTALESLRDEIYVLSCAVADIEADIADTPRATVAELREALRWLLEAARPVIAWTP